MGLTCWARPKLESVAVGGTQVAPRPLLHDPLYKGVKRVRSRWLIDGVGSDISDQRSTLRKYFFFASIAQQLTCVPGHSSVNASMDTPEEQRR